MPRALVIVLALAATLTVSASQAGAAQQSPAGPRSTESIGSLLADFDGNGIVDLAVGAPDENVGGTVDAGAASVFYGTTTGLPTTSQTLVQGNVEAGDHFGAALAAGYFNNDGFADLAVGAPGENVGATVDAGAASVFYGSATGLSTTSQTLVQGNVEAGDRFGAALTAAPFDLAGNWDLAVGAPGENVGATVDAGAASVFYSTTTGLPTTSQTLVQGNVEAGDHFGGALDT